MTTKGLDSAVIVARALGNPARLRIVVALQAGELCVCQVKEILQLAQSTVSGHLRELRRAGLIVERKQGRWVHVALSENPVMQAWIQTAVAAVGDDSQIHGDHLTVRALRLVPVDDLCRLGLEEALAAQSRSAPLRDG